jgi:transcriptional regulator with XRE-family HTH domain
MADLPIGVAVQKIRENRGFTKLEVARVSGLTRQYLWKIESGFVNPTLPVLDAVSRGLNIELWKLIRFAQKLQLENARLSL